jgi:hypothetical protein
MNDRGEGSVFWNLAHCNWAASEKWHPNLLSIVHAQCPVWGSKPEILATSRCFPLLHNNGHRVGAGEFVPAAFAMWQRRRDSPTSVNKNIVEAIDGKRPVN